MMEENNDTLLAGGDALMYLTEPTHKKYSTKMFWAIHLVRTYLMTDFSIPLLLHLSRLSVILLCFHDC